MYTILVAQDNELVASIRERIMHRSKMVNKLHFLVDPIYKGIDMTDFTVTLKYKLPISNEPCSEILICSDELYKEKLEYVLPLDTKFTKESGNIELFLTFTKVDLDADGNQTQYVRQTSETTIPIIPIPAWSSGTNDSALNAVDQKLLEVDAKIKELEEISGIVVTTKADNIVLNEETHELYLTADGEVIGNKIDMDSLGSILVEATEEEGLVTMII